METCGTLRVGLGTLAGTPARQSPFPAKQIRKILRKSTQGEVAAWPKAAVG
jgi:hypothetical protein